MAEKKVSSKNISDNEKRIRNEKKEIYEDFVAKFGPELRKRSTRTVPQPQKPEQQDIRTEISRCGELDPHTTVNPAVQHQIMTKRTGRILSDDTGFKADKYNDRFELTAEMPEIRDEDNVTESELEQPGIPGQQTMADLFESEDTVVPVESQIEDDDPFRNAYEQLKTDASDFGKSEKLRAIARTAADDAGMEPESQLTFPAFDPLFKFPEKQEQKKERKIKLRERPKKEAVKQDEGFDIDEAAIVTNTEEVPELPDDTEKAEDQTKKLLSDKKQKFFDFMKDSGNSTEAEPPFEISGKAEIKETIRRLTVIGKTALIKTGILFILGIITFILSAVFDSNDDSIIRAVPILYNGICLIFTLLAAGVCIKELSEGIKDFAKKKFTLNTGAILITAAALLQNICAFFAADAFPGNVHIITAAAIFSLTAVVLPKLFLTNNSRLAIGMISGQNPVTIIKKAQESGIDGALTARYGTKSGNVRYACKTDFVTGMMQKLTNAVPRPFAANASYVFILAFALLVCVASGFICKSFITGITAFSSIIIACIPVTYILTASILLYNINNSTAKINSSLLNYRCAAELTETDALVFDAGELIEQASCSIHGIKPFGRTDPRKSTLYCAAAVNGAFSPLAGIMKQVTDQSEEAVPVAENIEVTAFKGIRAVIEGSSILLGSREFLEENKVLIPDESFEEKFITGDRKLLYLSVNGEFSMLLIVSYHIKRSVSAFLKFLCEKGISIVIHSSDPNITPAFIAKKCKLNAGMLYAAESAEAAYLRDKESRTETAMPADAFTDGNITSLSAIIRNAFRIKSITDILPLVIYGLSALSALLIAAPILLGNAAVISNIYIILLRLVGIGAIIALSTIKQRK